MNAADTKTQRVLATLNHQEPDRVPVGEFFWTNFLKRVKAEWGEGDGFNPYAHWDLDLIVLVPNMDPHITGIEVLEDSPERRLVKTGFGATIEQRADYPMPHYLDFETKSYEQMPIARKRSSGVTSNALLPIGIGLTTRRRGRRTGSYHRPIHRFTGSTFGSRTHESTMWARSPRE